MDELCFELKSKGIKAPRFTYVSNEEEYILSQYETSPPQEQRIVCHMPTLHDRRLYHKEVQMFMWKRFSPLNPFMFNLIRLGNYQLMPPIKELTEKQAKDAVSSLVFKKKPIYTFFKAAPPSPSTLFHALETLRMSSLSDIYAHHVGAIKDYVRRDKEAKRIWDGVNALIDQINAIPVVTIDSDMDLVEIVVLVCMYRALNIEPLYVKVHSRITKAVSPKIIRNAEKRLRRIMLGPSEYSKSKHKSVNLKEANKAAVEKAVQYLESASQSISAVMSIDEFSEPDEISGFRWSRNVLSGISLPFEGKISDRKLINKLKFGSRTQPLEMNISVTFGGGGADKYYSQDLKRALVRAIESQLMAKESESAAYIATLKRSGWREVYEELKAITDTTKLQRLLDDDVTPWLKQRVFMRADLPLLEQYEVLQSMLWKIIKDRSVKESAAVVEEETSEETIYRRRIQWFSFNRTIYDLLMGILSKSRLQIISFIMDTFVKIYNEIYTKVLTVSTATGYEYYKRLLVLLFDLASYRLNSGFLEKRGFDIKGLKQYFKRFPIMVEAILQYERKNNIKSNWELLGYIKKELYYEQKNK